MIPFDSTKVTLLPSDEMRFDLVGKVRRIRLLWSTVLFVYNFCGNRVDVEIDPFSSILLQFLWILVRYYKVQWWIQWGSVTFSLLCHRHPFLLPHKFELVSFWRIGDEIWPINKIWARIPGIDLWNNLAPPFWESRLEMRSPTKITDFAVGHTYMLGRLPFEQKEDKFYGKSRIRIIRYICISRGWAWIRRVV